MNKPNQNKPKSIPELTTQDYKQAADGAGRMVLEFIRCIAAWFLPFFRKKVGDRFYKYGALTVGSLVLMIPATPVLAFFTPLWLFFLVIGGVDRQAHSECGGDSRVGSRFIEPLLVCGLGVCFAPFDAAFACICFIGALAMFMLTAHEWQQLNLFRRKMRDDGEKMRIMSEVRQGRW